MHERAADRALCATHAQPCAWRTASRPLVLPVLAASAWGCTVVHPCGTPVRSSVFLYFAILGARGFLKPLIFLEITREVFFSIET